jgi:hypothetical protein
MFGNSQKQKMRRVDEVLQTSNRGIYKRIDENRELLELLQREAPELLARQPWVEGWLASQDGFLMDLAKAAGYPSKQEFLRDYPRPWPGRGTDGAVVIELGRAAP